MHFKQANHGAYSNLATQLGDQGFQPCFADRLNQTLVSSAGTG